MNRTIDINSPVIDFGNLDAIMLDTCTVKNILNGQDDALKFVKVTNENNIVLCYSVKVVEELNIINQRNNIPPNKKQAQPYIDVYLAKSFEQTNRMLEKLNEVPNIYPEAIGVIDNDIIKKATYNGKEYKLRWGDSMIYTLAVENGVNALWTYDGDYKSVNDNMTIFKGNISK